MNKFLLLVVGSVFVLTSCGVGLENQKKEIAKQRQKELKLFSKDEIQNPRDKGRAKVN